jgi:hypothetical protein
MMDLVRSIAIRACSTSASLCLPHLIAQLGLSSENPIGNPEFEMENPIDALSVSLTQTSRAEPVTITITVTNSNDHPVTILDYASPLDSLALWIGILSIRPTGQSSPIDIDTIQLKRLWPPSRDSLTEIPAGSSKEGRIEIDPTITRREELKDGATLKLDGKWLGVWGKAKDDITDESLNHVPASKDVFTGEFSSGTLEIEFD